MIQATNTEPFCKLSGEFRLALQHNKAAIAAAKAPTAEAAPLSLVELVRKDAERYCTEDDLLRVLNAVKEYAPTHHFGAEYSALFKTQIDCSSDALKDLPDAASIGSWINKSTAELFARTTTVREQYEETIQVPKKRNGSMFFTFEDSKPDFEAKTVTKNRDRVTGFEHTQKVPFNVIRIQAVPQQQNLKWHTWIVTFLFSKTSLYYFFKKGILKEVNWAEKKLSMEAPWSLLEVALKPPQASVDGFAQLLGNFERAVVEPLREQFMKESDSKATKTETQKSGGDKESKADQPIKKN